MIEYEYSNEVNNLSKYINYCNSNGYILDKKEVQTRTIYRNENKTIARITINDNGEKVLDFKEDKLSSSELTVRKESLPIRFEDDEAVYSILEFLNYKKDNTMKRIRYTYRKEKIIFELDEYEEPDKRYIVSLEGDKEIVDKIWKEIN